VPTRDRLDLLDRCVTSLLDRTVYDKFRLVVVDNGSREPRTHRFFSQLRSPHRVLRCDEDFNWSRLNNLAARNSDAPFLVFLNNDIEILDGTWLEALLEHSQRNEVGVVGAKLLYPDGRLQHAGVTLGIGGAAGHAFKGLREDDARAWLSDVVRNCSAVTGACMMTRASVFREVGGFDEKLRVAFNDVDFCLRVREAGYRVVYTPNARLVHHESATRGTLHPREDDQLMRRRWRALLSECDPFYNPNLSQGHEDYRIAE
jgi:O-antigen biosynthesis protein